MPRVYKPKPGAKQYKRYDINIIQEAVDEYLSGNGSLKNVATKYNIHTSVLYRHSKGVLKSQGGQRALSLDTENYLIQYINICADWGYPLDSLDLRYIIKMYLDKLGINHKRFKNNLPGPDFIQSFLHRHKDKISQRICQNVKRSRAAVSAEVIKNYFEELQKSLTDVPPGNIVNYDETNLADDPGRRKILTKRGTKYPERIMNHSKASISIMMAGSADGHLLPPYVVYKAQHLYNTWISHGPRGARYNRTASGWFDGVVFEDWVQTIVIPFFENKQGKKLLIGDNLSSHLSVEMIRLCKEKNIHFVFLPSNSTHLTQPLDVAFFKPMKVAWRKILLKWKKCDGSNENSVPKGCFPKLLKTLMENIQDNAASNLRAGFKKTGIYPLDPSQVLNRLPTEIKDTDRYKEAVDESVLNLLSEMRYGTMGAKDNKRKRKVEVVAGKSVQGESTDDDYVDSEPIAGPSTSKKLRNQNNKDKENIPLQETTEMIKKNKPGRKGKGIGNKTKVTESSSIKINSDKQSDKDTNEDIENSILNMPVYFEDDLECRKEVESEDTKENKRKRKVEMVTGKCVQGESTDDDYVDSKPIAGPCTSKELINQNNKDKKNLPMQETTEKVEKNIPGRKGKGIGKKTKVTENNSVKLDSDVQADKNTNEDIENTILNMPVYFEDDLECGKEVEIENMLPEINLEWDDTNLFPNSSLMDNKKEEKIKILENKNFIDCNKKKFHVDKYKKISPTEPIKILKISKPKKYYKDDKAILKDLLDDNV